MKINRTNAEIKHVKPEDIYQLGNIIEDSRGEYYLVVQDNETYEYGLVELLSNKVLTCRVATLEELAEIYHDNGDRVVNATLTVED